MTGRAPATAAGVYPQYQRRQVYGAGGDGGTGPGGVTIDGIFGRIPEPGWRTTFGPGAPGIPGVPEVDTQGGPRADVGPYGRRRTGRWYRRGNKIVLVGV